MPEDFLLKGATSSDKARLCELRSDLAYPLNESVIIRNESYLSSGCYRNRWIKKITNISIQDKITNKKTSYCFINNYIVYECLSNLDNEKYQKIALKKNKHRFNKDSHQNSNKDHNEIFNVLKINENVNEAEFDKHYKAYTELILANTP